MTGLLDAAASKIKAWREDPILFVRENFSVEPDEWQADVLRAFPKEQRIAMRACKGPGKTATESWLAWNFLATRPHPKVAATSISATNLADNLWTEMAHWQNKSKYLSAAFEWTKTRIFAKSAPETWWMTARTWSRDANPQAQADTLAGLHADYLLFILDEVGGIPDGVMVAAEAGLATGKECKIVIGGNPTHLSGPLYRACNSERGMWYVVEVTGDPDDPKRSPRISIDWARQQIKQWGADSPWVLVNVFGKFPSASINALLGVDDVLASIGRQYKITDYNFSPKILGVDVARQGSDSTVIFPRQGLVSFKPVQMRNADSSQVSGRLAQAEDKWKADATFIDATGGFGWGVIDAHRVLGRNPIAVEFAGKPNSDRYVNKRAEMYFEMAEWVKKGGALHPMAENFIAELTEPTYTFKGDKLLIEPKEQIAARLGHSPDFADALCLTFAQPVSPNLDPLRAYRRDGPRKSFDYNPIELMEA